jgi:hypothetical protein
MDPERPPIGATSPYRNLTPIISILNTPPTINLSNNGDRYIIGTNPTGDWSGTYSISGTSSIFQKRNSIVELTVGYYNPDTGVISGETASFSGWLPSTPFVATWSYYPSYKNDLVSNMSTSTQMTFNGTIWSVISDISNEEDKWLNRFSGDGIFANSSFYDQITEIIRNEELFDGIDFIFETHGKSSQYIHTELDEDYSKYDKTQAEEKKLRNFYILSVKYKSSYGDIKLEIENQKPSILINFEDSSLGDLGVSLGATGLNPPFEWSFIYLNDYSYDVNYQRPDYSSQQQYLLPEIVNLNEFEWINNKNWIFDVIVKDSAGLTSNSGIYSVNLGSTYSFNGTFSYISL